MWKYNRDSFAALGIRDPAALFNSIRNEPTCFLDQEIENAVNRCVDHLVAQDVYGFAKHRKPIYSFEALSKEKLLPSRIAACINRWQAQEFNQNVPTLPYHDDIRELDLETIQVLRKGISNLGTQGAYELLAMKLLCMQTTGFTRKAKPVAMPLDESIIDTFVDNGLSVTATQKFMAALDKPEMRHAVQRLLELKAG